MKLFADTRPLRYDNYRRLWLANIVTVLGAQMTVVAIPAQIFHITGSSGYVGLSGVFGLVPLIVFGLWGGSLADVIDRRKLLIVSTAGLIVTSALLAVLAIIRIDNVWLLLSVFALQQAFFGLNQPARGALLPTIVPLALLPAANSLNMTVATLGAVAGPVIGGALIPVFGYQMLYILDALFLATTLYAVVKLPALIPGKQPDTRSGFKGVVDGFRYLGTNTVVMVSLLVDVIAMVFGMPRALFPQIATETFGGPPEGGIVFSLLFASLAAGSALAGIFSGWVSKVERQGLAVIVAILVWGAAMGIFGFSLEFASGFWTAALIVALFGLALGGGADIISAAFRSTMLQEAASDDMRGRMQGVFIVVVAGGPRIADIVHGYAAEATNTTIASAGGGIAVIVLVLICAAVFPAFRRYSVDRGGPDDLRTVA
ncbi:MULTISPECIES: MFS transporter [Brevibacterium]|uniref:Enterobactin exporter EntS n=2 Tax=Brevibacterium TaxID=1696 RepID=A0A161S802_9MICO|nr:MFS transporter [Brevibacterium casei]NJE67930.1 MFS transporter [Brevibacterium sp. LS14]KZE20860.1 MFS transporter permease [Brevibacterium casei]MBE4693601.1 MFS transporter [Brevibacterium casei]MBY3576724.1 MFS transporter [Brevibacterium casei]MCT2184000.1 MFS transporter [Brevibacterium casei]